MIWFHHGLRERNTEWFSCWPTKTLEYCGENITKTVDYDANVALLDGEWFDILKSHMADYEAAGSDVFTGGLAGHLTYDLGLELHSLSSQFQKLSYELANVSVFDWSCHIDHNNQVAKVYIQDHCPTPIFKRILEYCSTISSRGKQTQANESALTWHSLMSQADYQTAFNAIRNYIVEGDAYQINLTRQWTAENLSISDWQLYKNLIAKMPAPFSVFHRAKSHSLLSVSPERFIQIRGNEILTQPIKGTRPRGKSPEADDALLNDLISSEKDRAENLMIVDLLRNDIAKNSVAGTVTVEKLFEPHSFNNVHHLISSIRAERHPKSHPLDVLRDAFPGGSITGAPKKRAMQIIDELESVRRGNYCGCAFFLGANNRLDSNILIRTVTYQEGTITCNGGGGIVFDSDAEAEYKESEFKIASILKAMSGQS